tara:strand:+ start:1139 stop:1804 length:666 start_codon:yes stop_codon:yes gene_type:complete
MASFTRTIPVEAPRTDTEAAERASSIRGELTPEQKRDREYNAPPKKIPPHHKMAQELYEALCNAKTFSELEQASSFYEEFKRGEGRISGHYGKMLSKNKCDYDFGNRINKKAAKVQGKIDAMGEVFNSEAHGDRTLQEAKVELKKTLGSDYDTDDYDFSSSDDEEAVTGAGAFKEGGRRRRRKSKKRKKKNKKKTRKKRKKRKTRKKRKLRKKKRRKTNRK